MRLPSPPSAPPTVLLGALSRYTPLPKLAKAVVAATFRPMTFPRTRLENALAPSMRMPCWVFPEMTLRSPANGPPTETNGVPLTNTPLIELPRAVVPDAFSPMRLPTTRRFDEDKPFTSTPFWLLPEMVLAWAEVGPPMRTFAEFVTEMPLIVLPWSAPAASSPMTQPSMTWRSPPMMRMPSALKRLIRSERSVTGPAARRRPSVPLVLEMPFSSMTGEPANPGCVDPSMTSSSVTVGRELVGKIVKPPDGMLKEIVSGPGDALASRMAWRRVPAPFSLVATTEKLAANEAQALKHSPARSAMNRVFMVRSSEEVFCDFVH